MEKNDKIVIKMGFSGQNCGFFSQFYLTNLLLGGIINITFQQER